MKKNAKSGIQKMMSKLAALLVSTFILFSQFISPPSLHPNVYHTPVVNAAQNLKAPSPKPSPTATASAKPVVKKVVNPSPTSVPLSKKQFIMKEINKFRSSQGLSAVQTDDKTCAFASTRVSEIAQGFNHDGFTNRINGSSLPYPSYKEVVENIAQTGNYQEVVSIWMNSSFHADNMKKDTPFVCVENQGDFYAYEGWHP